MGNRSIAPPLAVFAALAALAVPLPGRAAITVEPPTGNADPALLADLHTWMKMIAEEQGATVPVDAVLRIDATVSGEGVTLTLELAPSDGTAKVRETRTASRASAAAQARAMARAAIRKLTAPAESATTSSAVEHPQLQTADSATVAVEAVEDSAPPVKNFPDLKMPYNKKKALWLSVGPTFGAMTLRGAFIGLAFAVENDPGRMAMISIGLSLAGLGFFVGPSLGHFYVRNNLQGSLTLVFRTLLSGGAAAFFGAALASSLSGLSEVCFASPCGDDTGDEHEDAGDDGRSASGGYLAGGIITATAAVTLAIVDLATVRRAAQKANEKAAAEKEADAKISGVSIAPLLVPGPNGSTTTGLALSMRF